MIIDSANTTIEIIKYSIILNAIGSNKLCKIKAIIFTLTIF